MTDPLNPASTIQDVIDRLQGLIPQETRAKLSQAATGDVIAQLKGLILPIAAPTPVQKVETIVVAVHGIGDQFSYETVQSVAAQFCRYTGSPAAIPLGAFHGAKATIAGAYIPEDYPAFKKAVGFAEIYWANVPRQPVKDAHILEEPKKWARTIVERLHLRETRHGKVHATRRQLQDYRLIGQVLDEMITGVAIAQRLLFLAEKAGVLEFDLNKLLTDYLDDVQVVADFENYRKELLEIFAGVMAQVHHAFPNAHIHIVAHSEGTVVAFLGLLHGLTTSPPPPWLPQVRGLMTIGSPLNKHVVLWRQELFDGYSVPQQPPAVRITWRNYYDYGDPIGFDLRPTRVWMRKNGWNPFFEFVGPEENPQTFHDHGFTRYYFPGKAHNDYWNDLGVFGHFIQEVVDPKVNGQRKLKPDPDVEYGIPRTDPLAAMTSYLLPYVLAAGILLVAVYILYRAVRGCVAPMEFEREPALTTLKNVVGLASLVGGMSVLARIPRLTRSLFFRIVGMFVFAVSAWGFLLVEPETRGKLGDAFTWHVLPLWGLLIAILALGVAWLLLYLSIRSQPNVDPWPLTLNGVFAILALAFVSRVPEGAMAIPLVVFAGVMVWTVVEFFVPKLRPTSGRLENVLPASLSEDQRKRTLEQQRRNPARSIGGFILGFLTIGLLLILGLGSGTVSVPADPATKVLIALSAVVGLLAWSLSRSYPQMGLKPLIYTGGFLILVLVASRIGQHDSATVGPIWPVILAGIFFLYLWWLAALAFDLAFIWHLYIRGRGATERLELAAN